MHVKDRSCNSPEGLQLYLKETPTYPPSKPKVTGISESRMGTGRSNINIDNYIYGCTSTESSKGGTLLCIDESLKYKLRKDLKLNKPKEIEISQQYHLRKDSNLSLQPPHSISTSPRTSQKSFFLLRLLCISINLPYNHAWNTVVMSGLVLLVATWICWISYKNKYAGLLVLHLQPLLNP